MTHFLIAETFLNGLARLTNDEQKAVKMSAFDLQTNPDSPGLQFHKLDKCRDKNFWSVRVNKDIRLIVHRTEGSLLLCYVDHHDKAYAWAERRKLEAHPTTGAAQIIEIRETAKDIIVPRYADSMASGDQTPTKSARPLFSDLADGKLLGLGVPPEWLPEVRDATEDTVLDIVSHLPAEAAEALLEIATGGRRPDVSGFMTDPSGLEQLSMSAPSSYDFATGAQPIEQARAPVDPFEHPDAQRRFRSITNIEELERALDYPWDQWSVFLHPIQRNLVERNYSGPARVGGSAGTGKTIVALHRAAYLARRNPDARILLTTFSDSLASALRTKVRRLIGNEPRLGERIDVHSLDGLALRLFKAQIGPVALAGRDVIRDLLRSASSAVPGHKFKLHFLVEEWEQVVDAWQLDSWEAYRDVARLGRKTRLPEAQRKMLWAMFDRVRNELRGRKLMTQAGVFTSLSKELAAGKPRPFDFAVVDEAQDVGVAQLRFFAALGGGRANALFFAGDLGQRIFQTPFSWKSLGVDVRGRSRTLRVNYRTSHQIRTQADRLLAPAVVDVDGNEEYRGGTVSVFNGPPPTVRVLESEGAETSFVAAWLKARGGEGVQPQEIGIIVRSAAQLARAQAAASAAGLAGRVLDEHVETASGHVSLSTMHVAKGLEFRVVAVMACDDDILPLQERIEAVGDDADLQEVYDTERHLLYVACTRARDHLLVTAVAPASEFLDDFQPQSAGA